MATDEPSPEPEEGVQPAESEGSEAAEIDDILVPVPRGQRASGDGEAGRSLLLRGMAPAELLVHLLEADSLGLLPLGARRLRQRALLIDTERLHLEAARRVALVRYDGRELEAWLTARVDEAIETCRRRDQESVRNGSQSADGEHEFMEIAFGVANGLRSAHAFNSLTPALRAVTLSLLVDGESLSSVLEHSCFASTEELGEALRTALQALLDGESTAVDPPSRMETPRDA